ncbi:MAG: hypothetical protein ABMA64_07415, partial [Myxococcota bacterium]
PVEERGAAAADGATGDRAAAVAAVAERDARARASRERLLFDTLTDLSAAADRAEASGQPEYAAALRRRASALSQRVRMD